MSCKGIASSLFNYFSNILGCSTVRLVKNDENQGHFLHVSVPRNLIIENMAVAGKVLSKKGDIKASNCTLKTVHTPGNIGFVNCSAKFVSSYGNGKTTIRQTDGVQRAVRDIWVFGDIEVDSISQHWEDSRINSCYRSITANNSSLGNVHANHNVHLINSSAKNISSGFGCITVKQLDGIQRTVSTILTMHHSVVVDHCHITDYVWCHQKGVITNSHVNGFLSLRIDPRHQGFLDLTKTQVDGPISISICNPVQTSEDPPLAPLPEEFSILIKGNVNLEKLKFNLDLEYPYEISDEQTDEGILIRGKKIVTQLPS